MQNAGIQTLLEAEKEASKIIAKAKQYRVNRIKEARQEAQKEIESLKQQKQEEFKKLNVQVSIDVSKFEQEIVNMEKLFQANKQNVIDKVLSTLVTVEPRMHDNVLFKLKAPKATK